MYLEPWHADVFEFLDLRKNHGKVWLTGVVFLTSHEGIVFLHYLQSYPYLSHVYDIMFSFNLSCISCYFQCVK